MHLFPILEPCENSPFFREITIFPKKNLSPFLGEELMDYLASPEAMELPDQIEEVNAKQLDTLVQEKMFVAVLFCKLFSFFLNKINTYIYMCIVRN